MRFGKQDEVVKAVPGLLAQQAEIQGADFTWRKLARDLGLDIRDLRRARRGERPLSKTSLTRLIRLRIEQLLGDLPDEVAEFFNDLLSGQVQQREPEYWVIDGNVPHKEHIVSESLAELKAIGVPVYRSPVPPGSRVSSRTLEDELTAAARRRS